MFGCLEGQIGKVECGLRCLRRDEEEDKPTVQSLATAPTSSSSPCNMGRCINNRKEARRHHHSPTACPIKGRDFPSRGISRVVSLPANTCQAAARKMSRPCSSRGLVRNCPTPNPQSQENREKRGVPTTKRIRHQTCPVNRHMAKPKRPAQRNAAGDCMIYPSQPSPTPLSLLHQSILFPLRTTYSFISLVSHTQPPSTSATRCSRLHQDTPGSI